jgi:purine-nucleoside phosphorylase
VQEAADVVRKSWLAAGSTSASPEELPHVILTTGSGLGALVDQIAQPAFEMSYEDIPHLPPSRIPGHAGRIVIGSFAHTGTKVVVLDGRVHGYEGHSPLTQALPLLIANELCGGARLAISTNAAGAINEQYHEGQIMLIKDHINFMGETLLNLSRETDIGGTNLDMTFAYTPAYRELLKAYAREQGIDLAEGVYIGVKGAMFETPAEIRAFRTWGADAVGMSTVHEVVAASRLGMKIVGLSVMSNMAAGVKAQELTHQEVLDNTALAADTLATLITAVLTHPL